MGVKEELTEPWGIVTAALLGGLGAAVTAAVATPAVLALPVGLAVAGAVYGVKVGLGALGTRPAKAPEPTGLPQPPRGSPAYGWLRRAESAVRTLHSQTESPADAVLRAQISDVDDQAAAALGDLRRFAGQVTLVEQTMASVDTRRLQLEYGTIQRGLSGLPSGPLRDERERALRAVRDQLDVSQRLAGVRETLLARMESAVLGLEGLVARLGELLALHATTSGADLTATRVAELTSDLEGMRAGLAEAEQLSRRTLAGGGSSPNSGA